MASPPTFYFHQSTVTWIGRLCPLRRSPLLSSLLSPLFICTLSPLVTYKSIQFRSLTLFIDQSVISRAQINSILTMVRSFTEQCSEDFIGKTELSSLVPRIKPSRTTIGEKIRRTATFIAEASSRDTSRINRAVKIRQTKSLGEADTSLYRRFDIVKRPAQTSKSIAYSSLLTNDCTVATKKKANVLLRRSASSLKRASMSQRIVRHRTFQENGRKKSFRKVQLSRNGSVPEKKKNAVSHITKPDSGSYLSEASSGGRKIRLSSSRMRGKSNEKKSLEVLQEILVEMSQNDISRYDEGSSDNKRTAQSEISNRNGQSTQQYSKLDHKQKFYQYGLMAVANHRQKLFSKEGKYASDINGLMEILTDSDTNFDDSQNSFVYRRNGVLRVPTFIQRQEAWQMKNDRYFRKSFDPAQNSQQYSDHGSNDSDTTIEPLIGKNNKEINYGNRISSEFGTENTGYGSLSPTIVYLHDWRPPMPSKFLDCCGCERCSSVLNVVSGKDGRTNGRLTPRSFVGSVYSSAETLATNIEVKNSPFTIFKFQHKLTFFFVFRIWNKVQMINLKQAIQKKVPL